MGDIAEVEQALKGVKFEKNAVLAVFEQCGAQHYFGNINAEELALLLVNGVYE